MSSSETDRTKDIKDVIGDILDVVEQEREREIILRRHGLDGDKETLEQVGELLGITRERVRQLEKAIMSRLKRYIGDDRIPSILSLDKQMVRTLSEMGRIARQDKFFDTFLGHAATPAERTHMTFIAQLAPSLTFINENDNYYQSLGVKDYGDERKICDNIDMIVSTIKNHGKPLTTDQLHEVLSFEHPDHIKALARTSKKLTSLNGKWGLADWPSINPKNIRDKIVVIMKQIGQPMHFNDIAQAVKNSKFKRTNVTPEAIHNELIKDDRFVLIGRGIYALDAWGYGKGTVADIIADVIKSSKEPMHRDDIVEKVLKKRQVKEATVLLNLQTKPQFKRVSKFVYDLAGEEGGEVLSSKSESKDLAEVSKQEANN